VEIAMSKVHVLQGTPEGAYQVVFHLTTPTAGTNYAGLTWDRAVQASGFPGPTCLVVGTNPWNISQAEADAIAAGTTFEIVETMNLGASLIADVNAALTARWTQINGEKATTLKAALRSFGVVRA
jgi:hypothetical protein